MIWTCAFVRRVRPQLTRQRSPTVKVHSERWFMETSRSSVNRSRRAVQPVVGMNTGRRAACEATDALGGLKPNLDPDNVPSLKGR